MKYLLVCVALSLISLPTRSFAATAYDVDIKLNNSLSYDSLDISVTYSAANGGFAGSGATVSCTPNPSLNATMAFNDTAPLLKAGVMRTTPIAGPVVLFTCTFDSNAGAPLASQFVLTLRGWESTTTTTAPALQVSRIQIK